MTPKSTEGQEMERRAVVIRTVGDPEIAGAIVDGMNRNLIPLNEGELLHMQTEYTRLKAREDVRKYRLDREWYKVQRSLERRYRIRRHGAVYETLLIGWALTCLFICECYRRLAERNRS
jgi:hypothetical protein